MQKRRVSDPWTLHSANHMLRPQEPNSRKVAKAPLQSPANLHQPREGLGQRDNGKDSLGPKKTFPTQESTPWKGKKPPLWGELKVT